MKIFYNISAPSAEPISLSMAKRQVRVRELETFEDDLLNEIRLEAVQIAEDYLERYLSERVIVIESNEFITAVEAQFRPIISVDSIRYKDENDVYQVLDPSNYSLEIVNKYDNILHYNDVDSLPVLFDTERAVEITGRVGYVAGEVPLRIISGVKLVVSHLYENRNDSPDEKVRASRNLLRPYKTW